MVFFIYLFIIFITLPISSAVFLAYFIFPIVNALHTKLRFPFLLSLLIISLIFSFGISCIALIIIQSLLQILPPLQVTMTSFSTDYITHPLLPFFLDKLATFVDSFTLALATLLKNSLNFIFELFIFTITFYFSIFESKKNRLWFFTFAPKKYRSEWERYFTKSMQLIQYFFFVELQLFAITFLLLSCGLAFLQFEGPVSKAFLISLADSLPFLGIGLFLIPMALYFFFIGEKLLAISLIVLYIFVQVTRQLVESKLWAHTMQLRMVHTFLISAVAVLLFGVYGILLSPILLLAAVKLKQTPIFER